MTSRVLSVEKAAVELLICPHCGGDLRENSGSLICSEGHTANIARQGYVSLLGRDSGTHTGDASETVAARARFLDSGHFRPLTDALVAAARGTGRDREETAPEPSGAVVDLGSGTGHYLAAVLEALPGRVGIGVDNSKFAARRTARCHPRASAVVADIWDEVPVRSGAAGVMLNVFSPRNGEEMARILAPRGRLVVVTPQAGHLAELIDRFGMISVDPDKEERLERSLGPLAGAAVSHSLDWEMKLAPHEVRDLVGMGPSGGRMEGAAQDALAALTAETAVTAAVTVTTTINENHRGGA